MVLQASMEELMLVAMLLSPLGKTMTTAMRKMLGDEEDYEPDYDHQSEDDDDPFADETDTAITNASASSSPKNSNGSSLHGKSNGTNVSSPVEDRKKSQ